jgi:hypothetical protein
VTRKIEGSLVMVYFLFPFLKIPCWKCHQQFVMEFYTEECITRSWSMSMEAEKRLSISATATKDDNDKLAK